MRKQIFFLFLLSVGRGLISAADAEPILWMCPGGQAPQRVSLTTTISPTTEDVPQALSPKIEGGETTPSQQSPPASLPGNADTSFTPVLLENASTSTQEPSTASSQQLSSRSADTGTVIASFHDASSTAPCNSQESRA